MILLLFYRGGGASGGRRWAHILADFGASERLCCAHAGFALVVALIRQDLSGFGGIAQTITGYSGYLNLWEICTQDADI
jgi:hypothetical protein